MDNMEEIGRDESVDELKPEIGQEFSSLDDAFNFYNVYAKQAGFSVRKSSEKKNISGEIIRKEYVCFKEGNSSMKEDKEKSRRRGSIRDGCQAKIAVTKSANGNYVVKVFNEGHSHPLSTPRKTHLLRSHRDVSSAQKCLSQQLSMVNIPTTQQYNFLGVQAGGFENVGCTQKDLYNHERDKCIELKGHDGEMFYEYMKMEQEKNPSFTFTIKGDDEQKVTHAFWADATSRRDYALYGDVVIFDTTYNTNRYGMIFAPLLGVNNHGQTIVFACAFLSDETIPSFVWLFEQFLEAMPGNAPQMIITDQDPAMTNAISQSLPSTYHRYCSWHILNKFSVKLDTVKYKAYYQQFYQCIWNSKSKEDFDLVWLELVQSSGLNDNKWLQSMFDIRSKWVPVYTNHIFSADMSSSQRAESSHSFFKKYVRSKNSLVDFMIQFGRGLRKQRHEGLIADNKDVIEKPNLKMPHDILVQMVEIYTHEMFYKFQEQLLESFNYKFHLISETDTRCVYRTQRKSVVTDKGREVSYEKDLDLVSCTCNKFLSSGIPCRHILAYFNKFTDIDELPSKYIMNRWKKSAKSDTVIDRGGMEIVDDKSYFLERSRLIQCCLGLVDKALTSKEAKKVLFDALGNAEEKINLLVNSIMSRKKTKAIIDSGTSGKRTSEMVDSVTNIDMSEPIDCDDVGIYGEPGQVRAKGCGKRLKSGKEKAIGSAKESKERLCKGCGQQGHNVRTCPKLAGVSLSQP